MIPKRELKPHESALLLKILGQASFPGATELREQVRETRISGGLTTFVDLEVATSAPRSACQDGPIPVRALVEGQDGTIEGELLVWVKEGYLSALEFAWFSDKAPTEMPSADRVVIDSG